MNNNNEFFLSKMKGVSPIKKKNTIKKITPSVKNQLVKKNIKLIHKDIVISNIITDDKKSNFDLENINIKKNLRKNFFKIDKKIDFHGKNLLDSEELFSNTIMGCYNNGLRCLLFVTGKGLFKVKNNYESSSPKLYHGVIREAFVKWVKLKKFSKQILSFEKASLEHGGDGAFYVYLRKKKTSYF